ncbi:MAG: DegT/DnrJ/EryC1/StrS family aminotransferase [Deltaproteobacteria bacterium]|nr:DegT/DnrJ/EryC1/StrS family aminotransferase [Deltaproteobacteria bacterium]
MIPVNEPLLGKAELNKVAACIKSNWISSQGKYLIEFEEKFARYCGVKYGISTTSGTTALHLALAAIGVGPGDEVLIPTFTMAATAFAVCYCGATPVFVDSDSETFNIDLERVSTYLRSQEKRGKIKAKAILPVHMYGHPVDMDPLLDISDRFSLTVIEDAAEAHGAEYKGKRCGGFGAFGCFSFYANKIITTGEGGMVVTNDPRLADKARRLKDLAHSPGKRFLHTDVGFNYRMTNLQAALGVAQLKKINSHIKKKRRMAKEYEKSLKGIPGLRLPVEKPWAKNVYWMYGILVEKAFGLSRDQLMAQLKIQGIDTRSFFVPMHLQTVFKDKAVKSKRFGRYPVAERLSEQGLYLPSGLTISRDQIRYIGGQIKRLAAEAFKRK